MNDTETKKSLCEICRRLHKVTENFQTINFGTIEQVQSRRDCNICRLVLGLLTASSITSHQSRSHGAAIHKSRQRVKLRRMARNAFVVWQEGLMRGEIGYFYPCDDDEVHPIVGLKLRDVAIDSPGTFDYSVVDQWITECDQNHLECLKSQSFRSMQRPRRTLLIDTVQNCLVEATTEFHYLALSYVRGDTNMFETTSANYTMLQEPGSLFEVLCGTASMATPSHNPD